MHNKDIDSQILKVSSEVARPIDPNDSVHHQRQPAQ